MGVNLYFNICVKVEMFLVGGYDEVILVIGVMLCNIDFFG